MNTSDYKMAAAYLRIYNNYFQLHHMLYLRGKVRRIQQHINHVRQPDPSREHR